MFREVLMLLAIVALLPGAQTVFGDTFKVREDDGNVAVVEARLAGEGQGTLAIERSDGRIELIPQSRVLDRKVGPNPEPIDCDAMIARLTEEFGKETFRAHAEPPYVVGLVLADRLDKKYESNAMKSLKNRADFMKKIEKIFQAFITELKMDCEKPKYPLVLLIFETDEVFVNYCKDDALGRGLPPEAMAGYYSPLTNRLAVRMSECHTFAVPLHEAIHQQVHNRGILARLAPIPVWFNEGIATSFEGNGEMIKNGPLKINSRYAKRARDSKNVNWDHVVADDKAFHGDVLAAEAYAHAWSIHWFLASKYRKKYIDYLELLGQKLPLQVDDAETRTADFEQVFGKRIGQLQDEFSPWLEQNANRQQVKLDDARHAGPFVTQRNLAEVEMKVLKHLDGELEAEGRMRNISLIRPMTYHITIETDGGTYAEWFVYNVAKGKQYELKKQLVTKLMKNSPDRPSDTFQIKVSSVLPDSETSKAWQQGQGPVPVWNPN